MPCSSGRRNRGGPGGPPRSRKKGSFSSRRSTWLATFGVQVPWGEAGGGARTPASPARWQPRGRGRGRGERQRPALGAFPPHLPRARRGGGGGGGGGGAARAARGPSVSRAGGEARPPRSPPLPPGRGRSPAGSRPSGPARARPVPAKGGRARRAPPLSGPGRGLAFSPPPLPPSALRPHLPVRSVPGPLRPGARRPRPLSSSRCGSPPARPGRSRAPAPRLPPSARPAGPGPASGLLTGHSAPPIPALGPALGGSILAARTHRASLPRFGSRADWLRYRSPKPNQRLHSAAAQNGAQPRTKAREGAGAGGAGARRRPPRVAPPPSSRPLAPGTARPPAPCPPAATAPAPQAVRAPRRAAAAGKAQAPAAAPPPFSSYPRLRLRAPCACAGATAGWPSECSRRVS